MKTSPRKLLTWRAWPPTVSGKRPASSGSPLRSKDGTAPTVSSASSDSVASGVGSSVAGGSLGDADALAPSLVHAATTSASSAMSRIEMRFKVISYDDAARAG